MNETITLSLRTNPTIHESHAPSQSHEFPLSSEDVDCLERFLCFFKEENENTLDPTAGGALVCHPFSPAFYQNLIGNQV